MKGYIFTFTVLFVVLGVSADATTCWEKKCRECPTSSLQIPGNEFVCNPRGMISLVWLDQVDQMTPYSSQPNNTTPTESKYACIKMLASDPRISGDSTDIISGCYWKESAQAFCQTLKDLEASRGKTDFKCDICFDDLCNSASSMRITFLLSMISAMFIIKSWLWA